MSISYAVFCLKKKTRAAQTEVAGVALAGFAHVVAARAHGPVGGARHLHTTRTAVRCTSVSDGTVRSRPTGPGSSPAGSELELDVFFECRGHHRDLHSFPTRRSSDLQHRRQL